ncbi:hypothetical protein TESG_07401 [Trichophyton tonsurans CBS 112818]|uniref:Uncharacterized protein n=1 Tax=Trichophyton tonsurans (strain CBS 112818) TaxID=647933 RepID=F2S929_TRIT1|nr:hypothetical protein TESG_07401 [Trichophyton tonsurans CBS 112818]
MAYKFPVLAQDVEDSLGQDAPTVLELSRVAKTGRSYHTQLMLLQTRTQPCVMDRRRRTSKSSTHMNSQATCDNCVRIDGPKHRGDAHLLSVVASLLFSAMYGESLDAIGCAGAGENH